MRLKAARTKAGMTQEQLAELARVDQSTVSAIERGQIKSPSYETVVRLAKALGVAPSELFPLPEDEQQVLPLREVAR